MNLKRAAYGIVLMVITLLSSYAVAAQPEPSANVKQSDLENWQCPNTFPPTVATMPLPVELTTDAGHVLLSLTLSTVAPLGFAQVSLDLTMDGSPIGADVLSSLQTQHVISLTRVVQVSKGAHTFGVTITCTGAVHVDHGWLMAYELPLVQQ
jgi:hypothetical protein